MNRFLAEITRAKEAEVAAARSIRPAAELHARIADLEPCRDFAGALTSAGTRIIAEVKRRSPSVESYLQQGSPAAIARRYVDAGAAALSLVTDAARFGTSAVEIRPMRRVTGLPLIAKDFVIDEHQILSLRTARADAVLLIARLLDDARLTGLHALARGIGLAVLVECHDQEDVRRAAEAGAGLIGINNRDLDTFDVSLETSRRLLPTLPAGCVKVIESGLTGRDQIRELQDRGADAFLIGGALLQHNDPGQRLRSFLGLDTEAEAS